ncbi:MAG: hypothetical protein AMXMBFR6_16250 [Betaproteobacteria bacterium]
MAESSLQPSELARETLRRLATQRLLPTPENYREIYHQIAGSPAHEPFAERTLKALAACLPKATPVQIELARRVNDSVTHRSWSRFAAAITHLAQSRHPSHQWGHLFRAFAEALSQEPTPQRRSAIESAIALAVNDTRDDVEQLHYRLQLLASHLGQRDATDESSAGVDTGPRAVHDQVAERKLCTLIAGWLEAAFTRAMADHPDVLAEVRFVAKRLATLTVADKAGDDLAALAHQLARLKGQLHSVSDENAEIRDSLSNLLQMLLTNVEALVADDSWLHGQVEVVRRALAPPLTARQLQEAECRLRDVIEKQAGLKQTMGHATDALKSMLAGFVTHLKAFADASDTYRSGLDEKAQRIASAKSIDELGDLIADVLGDTKAMQQQVAHSRDELHAMQTRVTLAEEEIDTLQKRLAQASEMVRHDALTGALNRTGLADAYAREIARAQRRGSGLCLAVIDIDNFKRLNDTHGHQVGDEALIHLAREVRQILRPTDTLARFGGEEFVVLLPDTRLEDAHDILVRLQRELTKKYFLAGSEKLLITFSCGVTPAGPEEDQATAIARADAAMYRAKQAGKNRVVAAE